MKISQEEIEAARRVIVHPEYVGFSRVDDKTLQAALEAAFTVRKASKQAKRERQRKEKDKQVQDSAKPSDSKA